MHGAAFLAYKAYGSDQDDDVVGYLDLVNALPGSPQRPELVEAELSVLRAIDFTVPARSLAQRVSAMLLTRDGDLCVSTDSFEYAVAFSSTILTPEWANDRLKTVATAAFALVADGAHAFPNMPAGVDRVAVVRYLNVLFNARNLT